ncbi:DUF6049 family protein [Nocardioides marmotae]|uniref:DUF6049 family protein n=1 Tax=Nocardioides marmotae TaxID=2663857 RepID=UPI0012B5ADCC|nr:DUF6049 family protein [Nocardioides marmotae]MBC9732396.1 hypothetical protein [Nocardioides marmotae]MTB83516.1 hypothetical protein [Nocardioides marmotae]
MLRPRSLRPALAAAVLTLAGAVTGLVVPPAPASPVVATRAPVAAVEADTAPLGVTIESLTPGAIPRRGPIRVAGSVINRSDETWSAIKLYPFLGSTPMTTAAELAAATEVPAEQEVGNRIVEVSDVVDELAPGEAAPFRLTLPASRITVDAAGVYWFGVHALGESAAGRVDGADGRARTFLPLVPRTTRGEIRTAIVVPLRRPIDHESDGSLADVTSWTRTLETGGTLRSLVDLGASAGDRPVSWLVDPALVDAVRRLADGNPPRSLGPTEPGDQGGPSEGPDASFSPEPDGDGGNEGDGGDSDSGDGENGENGGDRASRGHEPTADELLAAEAAATWLDRLSAAMSGDEVLALPYGDLDVAGALATDPGLLERTRDRSTEVTATWDVPTTPALGSPSGYLDPAAIRAVSPSDTLLVTDRMLGEDAPGVATVGGRRLVVTSSGAASGGPGPDDPLAAVALRQRVLAEAAVRLTSPGRKPLVVQLPAGWTPDSASGFFEGLDEGWVSLGTVAEAADRTGTPVDLADLDYPARQAERRLDPETFETATGLIGAGQVLQRVLRDNTEVAGEVSDEAFAAVSYSSRGRSTTTRLSLLASRRWIDGKLDSVTIEAPRGVALSSADGRFGATVVNDLAEPVEVSIQAVTDDPAALSIEGPRTVEVGANQRVSVLLDASTREPGVHRVRLVLTDHTDDPEDTPTPLGSAEEVSIRSIQASAVIWVIMGAGALLLFSAIAVRLVRRVRRARREEATG